MAPKRPKPLSGRELAGQIKAQFEAEKLARQEAGRKELERRQLEHEAKMVKWAQEDTERERTLQRKLRDLELEFLQTRQLKEEQELRVEGNKRAEELSKQIDELKEVGS